MKNQIKGKKVIKKKTRRSNGLTYGVQLECKVYLQETYQV